MNPEMQLFNPLDLELSRSTFEGSPSRSGSCNAGRLIPLFAHSVMPGDEFTYDVDSLIKMSTPVYPTMDLLFMDVFAFFVPYRLILSRRYGSPTLNDGNTDWKAIIGSQSNLINTPIPVDGLAIPTININDEIAPGTLLDYMDIDPNIYANDGNFKVNCFDVLSYFAIYNENFRDPNVMQPVTWAFAPTYNYVIPYGVVPLYANTPEYEANGVNDMSTDFEDGRKYTWVNALAPDDDADADASYYGEQWLPFPVCRFHGFFGSMLPWPQRNTEGVELPLGDSAPILTGEDHKVGADPEPLHFVYSDSSAVSGATRAQIDGNGKFVSAEGTPGTSTGFLVPKNLWADLSAATAANVNALRAAIQKQRWYEKLARSGNRYDELMYGTFGVRPHDSGDDRPRYLGGKRIPLRMDMVASTNGGTSASSGEGAGSLGSLGAFSHTNDRELKIHAGYDDWGTVMFVGCIRHHDTFGSGTDCRHLRKNRDDFYFPTFAHLGEMSVADVLLVDGDAAAGDVLGYVEAWQTDRTWLDRVSGLLRPGKNLDFMTYARSFDDAPDLATFLNASTQIEDVDRTLAVGSNASGFQFVYQFTFNIRARRPLPTHSIPGLMDHF